MKENKNIWRRASTLYGKAKKQIDQKGLVRELHKAYLED